VLRVSGLRRAVRTGRWVLVVLTAWASALAANEILFPDPGATVAATSRRGTENRKHATNRLLNPSIILERNLFGVAPVVAEANSGASAKGFDPNLKLRGTASSEGRAFAVFDNGDGVQEVYVIGERVFDGAKLDQVELNAAILTNRGRHKRYEIEIDDDVEAAPSKKGPVGPRGGIQATTPGKYRVDRREIDFAIENLNYVITQARAVPVLRDGKATGYKLFNIRPGSLFERLGLRNGDVVQRVNGNELDNPGKAIGMLDEIQSMEEIRMDFLRGGKPQTFEYAIR
jgi:general secretion pathway protein C